MNQLGCVNFPARGISVQRAKSGRVQEKPLHQGTEQSTGAHPTPQAVPLQYHEFFSVWEGYFMVLTMPRLECWNLPCFYLWLQARTQSPVSDLLLLASDLPDLQNKPNPVPSGTKLTFQINNAEICEGQLNIEKLWFLFNIPLRVFPAYQQVSNAGAAQSGASFIYFWKCLLNPVRIISLKNSAFISYFIFCSAVISPT